MRRYYIIQQEEETTPVAELVDELVDEPVVAPVRRYPTGEVIYNTLPESYQRSQNCGNCAAFDPLTYICSTYNAQVVASYWCPTWRGE